MPEPDLDLLETALGHRFKDKSLLERSLTHSSRAHEKGTPGADSESLEFLGDAVLSLVVSRMLFTRMGASQVGDLARARAHLVSETNLAIKARALNLGDHLRLGRGEERGGGRKKESLLADVYEAVLGAVFLDGGLAAAEALIERDFTEQVAMLGSAEGAVQDFKTDLQEALQAVGLPVPKYRVASESGPDHRKSFRVEVIVSGRVIARGTGSSKKAAEQQAAKKAIRRIGDLTTDPTGSAPKG